MNEKRIDLIYFFQQYHGCIPSLATTFAHILVAYGYQVTKMLYFLRLFMNRSNICKLRMRSAAQAGYVPLIRTSDNRKG